MIAGGAVTPSQQDLDALNDGAFNSILDRLAANYNAATQIGVSFFEMPAEVQTVMLDVAYQYGPNLRPNFLGYLTRGDFEGASRELLNWSGPNRSTPRLTDNAILLQRAIDSRAVPPVATRGRCP